MGRWKPLASVAVVAAVLAGAPALAEAQAGWYVTPSFTLTEEYDDNVFGVPTNKRSDFITRFTPGLTAGYRSEPLTLLGSYSLGAEVFANNTDLNGVNRHQAGLESRYLPTPLTTLALNATYREIESTTQFIATEPETRVPILELGRRRSSLIEAAPSVAHQFTPLTSGDASYAYARSDVSGGFVDTTHQGRLRLIRQLTPLDQGTVTYRIRQFESNRAESITSHAATLGWRRQFTPNTVLSLEAGPRFSNGDVGAEAAASLEHRFQQATLTLAYSRTETIAVGRSGAVTADTGSGSLRFEPFKATHVALVASVARLSDDNDSTFRDVTLYRAGATATYALTKWLTLRGSYGFSLQEADETIRHHIVSISLEFGYPIRLY